MNGAPIPFPAPERAHPSGARGCAGAAVSSRPTPANRSIGPAFAGAFQAAEIQAPDTPLDGTRRNLETYQRQTQGVLDSLTKGGAASLTPASQASPPP